MHYLTLGFMCHIGYNAVRGFSNQYDYLISMDLQIETLWGGNALKFSAFWPVFIT